MTAAALLQFWSDWLTIIEDFLTNSPAFWFVGLYVGFFAIDLLRQMLHVNR